MQHAASAPDSVIRTRAASRSATARARVSSSTWSRNCAAASRSRMIRDAKSSAFIA